MRGEDGLSEREKMVPYSPEIQQQIGMLNLRINDMMAQLNVVMKVIIEENSALKRENSELKSKQEKTSKS